MTALHSTDLELLERLGGNDAAVHRAVVRTTGRVVVAKHAGWDLPVVTARLGREAAVLRRVQHPALIRLVDQIDDADGRYLLLAHAPGGSLAELVAAGERFAPAALADLGARLAGALAALHAADVVHRDVHPGNVLLDAELQPLLADLDDALDGNAPALEGDHEVVGHPAHLDHRLLAGAAPGPTSDLHGLATTLWTLATGAPPARRDPASPVELPTHPAVPDPLHALLVACATGTVTDAGDVRTRFHELAVTLPQAAATVPPSPTATAHPPATDAATRAALPAAAHVVATTGSGTRRWGPRPHPATIPDRPAGKAWTHRARVATAVAVAVLVALGGLTLQRTTPASAPTVAAPPPVCAGTAMPDGGPRVRADLDGDGCAELLTLRDGELSTPTGRFRFGEDGDVLLAGDWDGDGRWGIGLYRPATGAVYLVEDPGPDATSTPAEQHPRGGTPVVVMDGDRHRVRVEPG